MCSIDELFSNHSLNEKEDPVERFTQALNENEVVGKFRELLIEHFSNSWLKIFRSAPELEKVLSDANQHDSEHQKCIAILLSQKKTIADSIMYYRSMDREVVKDSAIIAFLHDVAKTYYPNSPYGLFKDGMDKIHHDYFCFVSWLYGKDFCLSKEFFDDKSLNSSPNNERNTILREFFYSITSVFYHDFSSLDDENLINELTSITSPNSLSAPSKSSLEFMRGLEFIKAWIKFDSQAGKIYDWNSFVYGPNHSSWADIKSSLHRITNDCEEASKLLNNWLEDTEQEFQKLLYVNADLRNPTEGAIEQWARGIDSYLINIDKNLSDDSETRDEYNARKYNTLSKFCSELAPFQVKTWIKYSVKKDFQRILNATQQSSRHSFSESEEKWIQKEHYNSWKNTFLESLNELDIDSRLKILSCSTPFIDVKPPIDFAWWDELFSNLIAQDSIPPNLLCVWALAAIDKRLKHEEILPYIDKSIGILRGELSKTENTE